MMFASMGAVAEEFDFITVGLFKVNLPFFPTMIEDNQITDYILPD